MSESQRGERLAPELDDLTAQLERLTEVLPSVDAHLSNSRVNHNQFNSRTDDEGCIYGVSKTLSSEGNTEYKVDRRFPVDDNGMYQWWSFRWGDTINPTATYGTHTYSRRFLSDNDPNGVYYDCPMEEADRKRAEEILNTYEALSDE